MRCINRDVHSTYHPPLKPECLNDLFHPWNQFMTCTVDLFPSLHVWSLRSVKYKKRQESRVHQSGTSEEQRSQNRVLALTPIFCVEEPDTGINSESKAAFPVWIGFKTVFHCEVRQGAHCACRFDT
jgi:hypothetical protein